MTHTYKELSLSIIYSIKVGYRKVLKPVKMLSLLTEAPTACMRQDSVKLAKLKQLLAILIVLKSMLNSFIKDEMFRCKKSSIKTPMIFKKL